MHPLTHRCTQLPAEAANSPTSYHSLRGELLQLVHTVPGTVCSTRWTDGRDCLHRYYFLGSYPSAGLWPALLSLKDLAGLPLKGGMDHHRPNCPILSPLASVDTMWDNSVCDRRRPFPVRSTSDA